MAKDKNSSQNDTTVQNETLLENMRGIELENKTLKEQIAQLQEENTNNSKRVEITQQELAEKAEQIEALQTQVENLSGERNDIATQLQILQQNATQDDTLATENAALKEALGKAQSDLQEAQAKYKELADNMIQLKAKSKGIVLHEFPQAVLSALCEKLSKLYGREVTPIMVLEDYILKYNFSERWTEWFHPFVFKDSELLNIAQKINPNIQNLRQLKQALNIKDEN